jgi:transposase
MRVKEREPGDIEELRRRVKSERDALLRDRYRSVLMALEGKKCPEIVKSTGRARRSVQDWVYCYRDSGIETLIEADRSGRPTKLPREREAEFKARLDAGARPEDGVCTLRGKDVVAILEREFGVQHTVSSIYGVLERLSYSCLKPRPRHEKADPQAAEQFKLQAPLLSAP